MASGKVTSNSDEVYRPPGEKVEAAELVNYFQKIMYDDTATAGRKRFTIAHELGHILLGHPLREGEQHTRVFSKDRPEVEKEADMFAARILSPACVLWALDLHTPAEIAERCQISLTAAQVRADRMKILYAQQMFLTSPIERRVFEAFKPWIGKQNIRPD